MFSADFLTCRNGVSKNGTEWWMVTVFADTVTNGGDIAKLFCTENAYNAARSLTKRQRCRVMCGVDDNGRLIVSNIKAEQ